MAEFIALFWLADVLNLPFMAMFDTTYPLNGAFWILGWFLISVINECKQK
jgi:hypothetical protein